MPTLLLQFPAKRYHATPWGFHVNEGLIEWPPSPWRLLRAFISVGYTSALWNGGGPPPAARSLLDKLAATLPLYHLPRATGAHSRHYMPLGTLDKGRERTTLVFDTWAHVGDGAIAVSWDVQLDEAERSLLDALVSRLGYVGRSESWVAGQIATDSDYSAETANCFPDDDTAGLRRGFEQVALLAPVAAQVYAAWRSAAVAEVLRELAATGKKITAKLRRDAEVAYPDDLLACLEIETRWLRANGWNQPPGTRRVFYWRRCDALSSAAPRSSPRLSMAAPVEAMLLSLAGETATRGLLPSVARTLPQAEMLHKALVSQASQLGRHCVALSGCDDRGAPLRGSHEHAHVVPLDLDVDGHLDHVLIWAPMTLDSGAQAAVRAVRRAATKWGDTPLRLAVAGGGDLDVLRKIRGPLGHQLRTVLAPREGATTWVSLTPFVPPRFLKKNGRNTLHNQILAEFDSRGLPRPAAIDVLDAHENETARRHRHFKRVRQTGPKPPADVGFTICLSFRDPVCGPICLGYGSHFGLGLFQVDDVAVLGPNS